MRLNPTLFKILKIAIENLSRSKGIDVSGLWYKADGSIGITSLHLWMLVIAEAVNLLDFAQWIVMEYEEFQILLRRTEFTMDDTYWVLVDKE